MIGKSLNHQEIVMTFSSSPTPDDIQVIAQSILESFPDELMEAVEELEIKIEEFPDEALMQELDLDDAYELLAFFRSGKEIVPGVQKKIANDDDVLIIFRRPVLDLWCETGDDLNILMREVMIEEVARAAEFSEADIKAIIKTHHQGLL